MRVVAALLCFLLCGVAEAQAPLPRFDGDRALAFTREFVATGPRWVGSKGHAKAQAFLDGRGYVTPQDIKSIGQDVLRHRLLLSFEAEADGVTSDRLIDRLLDAVVPDPVAVR